MQTLQQEANTAESKARLIEHNHEAVNAVIHAMREALATGMSWGDLGRMVKEQRKQGNPVACMLVVCGVCGGGGGEWCVWCVVGWMGVNHVACMLVVWVLGVGCWGGVVWVDGM